MIVPGEQDSIFRFCENCSNLVVVFHIVSKLGRILEAQSDLSGKLRFLVSKTTSTFLDARQSVIKDGKPQASECRRF